MVTQPTGNQSLPLWGLDQLSAERPLPKAVNACKVINTSPLLFTAPGRGRKGSVLSWNEVISSGEGI